MFMERQHLASYPVDMIPGYDPGLDSVPPENSQICRL